MSRVTRRAPARVQAMIWQTRRNLSRESRISIRYEPALYRSDDGEVVHYLCHPGDVTTSLALDMFCWGYLPQAADVVVDVGAGLGEDAPAFSRLVGGMGLLLSVEAHVVFEGLERTVRANGLSNCKTWHAALAPITGPIDLAEDVRAWESNSVVIAPHERTVSVPGVTLRELLTRAGLSDTPIALLKRNIEGAEADVLSADPQALDNVANVVISCHDFKADATGDQRLRTRDSVAAPLESVGFTTSLRSDARPYVADTVYGARTSPRVSTNSSKARS